MGDVFRFLGAFLYVEQPGYPTSPYRRFARYTCTHEQYFAVRDVPPRCECGGVLEEWFEVVTCPACMNDLFYRPGEMLDEPCVAGRRHRPKPLSVGKPPLRRSR